MGAGDLGFDPSATIYIHPSRVVRLIGHDYPDMEMAPDAWGDSVLQTVYEAIKDAKANGKSFTCGFVTEVDWKNNQSTTTTNKNPSEGIDPILAAS